MVSRGPPEGGRGPFGRAKGPQKGVEGLLGGPRAPRGGSMAFWGFRGPP